MQSTLCHVDWNCSADSEEGEIFKKFTTTTTTTPTTTPMTTDNGRIFVTLGSGEYHFHDKDNQNAMAVVVAEWLRRWTRNPLGFPRAGSNPADNEFFLIDFHGSSYLTPWCNAKDTNAKHHSTRWNSMVFLVYHGYILSRFILFRLMFVCLLFNVSLENISLMRSGDFPIDGEG